MTVMLSAMLGLAGAWAADASVGEEMKSDVVLRALVDELQRGQNGLRIEDLERPYFLEYGLADAHRARIQAQLGALISDSANRSRRLSLQLRVGSYELDNTNFSGGFRGRFNRGRGGAAVPIEDDYTAIRQAIWWATDREYKSAVETFEQKKAFMEGKVIEDKPSDFSREEPSVHFDERVEVELDVQGMRTLAKRLSGIFLDYPLVKRSSLACNANVNNKYLVNSEGTRLRMAGRSCSLIISATVQADDGMEFSDRLAVYGETLEDLPDAGQLEKRCRDMVQRLLEVRTAPTLETYSGPVLFESEAAAVAFASYFARRFTGGQRALGVRTSADDFEKKIGKRILPRFMNVVDDPTAESVAGVTATGHYEYDDQGVPARKVELVQGGRLQAMLMSRNPSKKFERSTGHGRGMGGARAATGCLVVSAEEGSGQEQLREELLGACEDEDLEYGIRIARLGQAGADNSRFRFGRAPRGGTIPLVMYRVYPDGRQELVRGAEIARIDVKAFKRILAAGQEHYVHNAGGATPRTTAVPALLFEELDLAKIDRDFDLPPFMPSPLARAQ